MLKVGNCNSSGVGQGQSFVKAILGGGLGHLGLRDELEDSGL